MISSPFTKSRRALTAGAVLLGIALLPLIGLTTYEIGLLIDILILSLFALSFNLLFGYTGLLTFGHAAYYGIAGYSLAILLAGNIDAIGTVDSFLVAFAASIAITTIIAALFGIVCVQRGEIYFAMLTLAFNMLLYEAVFSFESLTEGSNGIIVPASSVDLFIIEFDVRSTVPFFYFTFVLFVLSAYILWRIVNSPYGQLIQAIRENSQRGEFIGVNVKLYRWSTFVIGGFFAGIAGSLAAIRNFIVSPQLLHWMTGAEPLFATLLGGPAAFVGPIIGAFLFVIIEVVLASFTQYWQFGLGLILIPLVLFTSNGVVGIVTDRDWNIKSNMNNSVKWVQSITYKGGDQNE